MHPAQQSAAASGAVQHEAKQALEILTEMATLLNTGLDRETLSICIAMCEAGVNPEALAAVIKELTREARAIAQQH